MGNGELGVMVLVSGRMCTGTFKCDFRWVFLQSGLKWCMYVLHDFEFEFQVSSEIGVVPTKFVQLSTHSS